MGRDIRANDPPRGPCDRKNSIPIENFNPGSKFSIPIEIFNLDRKFQSLSFHLRGPRSVQRRARSKISIHDRSLEIFNPEGRDRIFSIPPGPLGKEASDIFFDTPAFLRRALRHARVRPSIGDKFGESLGGSQAPPELLESPRTSSEVPLTSPEVPGLPRRSAPFSGKPDTLS